MNSGRAERARDAFSSPWFLFYDGQGSDKQQEGSRDQGLGVLEPLVRISLKFLFILY